MTQLRTPDSPDLDAHRRLVVAVLAQHWELPLPSGEYPHGRVHDLWREAQRAQMAMQRGWEVEARDKVDRMVQHVLRLSSKVSWFFSDPSLRALATEETIIHNACDWSVTSQEAQDCWAALRAEETRQSAAAMERLFEAREQLLEMRTVSLGDHELDVEVPHALEITWRDAWERWGRA